MFDWVVKQNSLYVVNDRLGFETEIAPAIFHRTGQWQGGKMCQACLRNKKMREKIQEFQASEHLVIEHTVKQGISFGT